MPICWPSCVPDLRPRPQRSSSLKAERRIYGSSRLWHQARALMQLRREMSAYDPKRTIEIFQRAPVPKA